MSKVQMSNVIQGFWRLNEWKMSKKELNHHLHTLIEQGITTMDHADIYGGYTCEGIFGEALSLTPSLRQKMQVVTKCGIVLPSEKMGFSQHIYDYSQQHIHASVDRSLEQLQVEEIDLLLLHRPSPLMNAHEVAETLAALNQAGKVRRFGVSNFKDHQYQLLKQAMLNAGLAIDVNQLEVSAVELENIEDGTLQRMKLDNVDIMAWSPLGGGKIFKEEGSSQKAVLETIAQQYDTTIDTIMYAWLKHLPYDIYPIVGSQKITRAAAALDAQQLSLTDNEWFEIYKQALGRDIL